MTRLGYCQCLAVVVVLMCSHLLVAERLVCNWDGTHAEYGSLIMLDTLQSHGPIAINSNAGFASQGWAGDGSASDPYVIERLNITTENQCVLISHTDVWFTIRDCYLRSTKGYQGFALYFEDVKNGIVENCILVSFGSWAPPGSDAIASGTGTKITESANCTFQNNIIQSNADGLVVDASSSLLFVDNTIRDNSYGVLISDTNRTVFSGNEIVNNWEGIWTLYLDSCTFHDQLISAKNLGMLVRYSTNLSIWNNAFEKCGLRFWGIRNADDLNHSVSENTVNGQALLYLHGLSNTTATGNDSGGVILADCDNTTLVGFHGGNASSAIQLISCTGCKVANCTSFENSEEGIYIYDSSDCIVEGSTLLNNLYGLRTDSSSHISISDNLFQFNFRGVSIYDTDSPSIQGNRILNTSYVGVKVSDHSTSITIQNNRIVNSSYGISIQYSTDGTISENIVYDCSSVGISLGYEAVGFRVFYNFVGWNRVNAVDDGGFNMWDDGVSRGNNWTDYCGSGVYAISGTNVGAADRYPSFLYDPSRPNATRPLCANIIILVVVSVSAIAVAFILLLVVLRKKSPSRLFQKGNPSVQAGVG
jgi:parallel beta-helix repeat protein